MSKSHRHQQSALLNRLVTRARSKEHGLSKPAMALAYGFDGEAQLNHALSELVNAGAIQIDIDGRWPSIRIHKTRIRTLHALSRPLFLSAGCDRGPTGEPQGDWRTTAATKSPADEGVKKPALITTPIPGPATSRTVPIPAAKPVSAVQAALDLETHREQAIPFYVGFRLPKDDYTWLLDEMDRSGEVTALPVFARDMLMAEMDRRRSPGATRHKISARVLRVAREEGLDLDSFVTSLIEVGLTAREMNRGGSLTL